MARKMSGYHVGLGKLRLLRKIFDWIVAIRILIASKYANTLLRKHYGE